MNNIKELLLQIESRIKRTSSNHDHSARMKGHFELGKDLGYKMEQWMRCFATLSSAMLVYLCFMLSFGSDRFLSAGPP